MKCGEAAFSEWGLAPGVRTNQSAAAPGRSILYDVPPQSYGVCSSIYEEFQIIGSCFPCPTPQRVLPRDVRCNILTEPQCSAQAVRIRIYSEQITECLPEWSRAMPVPAALLVVHPRPLRTII